MTDLRPGVAEQFGLVFAPPDYLRDLYESFGSTLVRFHEESEYRLPIPARYVIDQEGIIRSADVNADYTIRPEPSETRNALKGGTSWTLSAIPTADEILRALAAVGAD